MAAQNRLHAAGVEEKLREFHGNYAAVARAFGVTRQAVQGYIQRHPSLQAVAKECRETMLDHAESSLYGAVLKGEGWAVKFFLGTQGKSRGYVERTEIQQVGDEDLDATIERELAKLAGGRTPPPAGPADLPEPVVPAAGSADDSVPLPG